MVTLDKYGALIRSATGSAIGISPTRDRRSLLTASIDLLGMLNAFGRYRLQDALITLTVLKLSSMRLAD
jgi:hypothetical protein